MYSEGYAGLTLAISSLLMIPFGDNYETTVFILVSTLLASLPDIDLSRAHTHMRVVLRGVLFYLYNAWIYILI